MRRAVALLVATVLAIAVGLRGVAVEWSQSTVYGISLLAVVLVVAASAPLVMRATQAQRGSARAVVHPKLTFADVGGLDEAVEELAEVRD